MCSSLIFHPSPVPLPLPLSLFPPPSSIRLASQQSSLEGQIQEYEEEIRQLEGHLGSLQPSLEGVRRATLPLQEALNLPLDRLREEQEMATLLPL